MFSFFLLAIQFSSFIWVLIWAKVSERIGKQNVYYLGAGFFVLALMGMFFLQPGAGGGDFPPGGHGGDRHLGGIPGAVEHGAGCDGIG